MGTATRMGPAAAPEKASRRRARRADGYQRARQAALRGRGRAIATALRISFYSLQHELDDASRDPVRRVADRLRALRGAGATAEQLHLYAAEILDVVDRSVREDPRPLTTLEQLETAIDGDEDLTQLPALLHQGPMARAARVDQLRRYAAHATVLAGRYEQLDADGAA